MPSRSSELVSYAETRLDEALATGDVVDASLITTEVEAHFRATVPNFFDQLGVEKSRGLVHDVILKGIARTRKGSQPLIPTTAASIADKRLKRSPKTWGEWLEFTGTHHVRYMAMTRPDLLAAAKIRRARGEREIHLAALHELVAGQLPDDVTRVEQVLTPEEVETISAGIQVRYGVTWDDLLGKYASMVTPPTLITPEPPPEPTPPSDDDTDDQDGDQETAAD